VNAESTVAFEMITENITKIKMQLDGIRSRYVKFICVNDNLITVSPEIEKLVSDFYQSYFPHPSKFELPIRKRNPILRLN
jgi:hypothetical protein